MIAPTLLTPISAKTILGLSPAVNSILPQSTVTLPGLVAPTIPTTITPQANINLSTANKTPEEIMKEKEERAALIQKQIQEKLEQINRERAKKNEMAGIKTAPVEKVGAPPLDILNIPVAPVATIRANIKKQREEKAKKFTVEKPPDLRKDNPFFDPRATVPKTRRATRKILNFVEPGKYIEKAEKMRMQAEIGKTLSSKKHSSNNNDMDDKMMTEFGGSGINPNLIPLSNKKFEITRKQVDAVPDVEWWDAPLLQNKSYSDIDVEKNTFSLKEGKFTHYVEHPVPIGTPADKASTVAPTPLMLTKKERKKLRTQSRLQKQKEKQEKIRLGLMPTDQPKATHANMMKVFGTDAALNPTAIDMMVTAQKDERLRRHLAENAARKATKQQKREKRMQKISQDRSSELQVALFRIGDLSDPRNQFKLTVNGNELHLTGCVIMCGDTNIVVAEGGPKGIKYYEKLLMRRIDWNAVRDDDGSESDSDSDSETEDAKMDTSNDDGANNGAKTISGVSKEKKENKCLLVWKGTVKKNNFRKFRTQKFATEAQAQKYLSDHGVAHYWDMCSAFNEIQSNIMI